MKHPWVKLSLLVKAFDALCLSNTDARKVGLLCDRSFGVIGKYLGVPSLDVNAEVSQTLDIRQLSQTETIRFIYGGSLQDSLLVVEPHLRGMTPNHKHINRDLCDMCISSGFQSTTLL